MVEASASGAVDSGLILSRVKPMTLILVFTASLLDAQHHRDSVENKLASRWEKHLAEFPHLRVVGGWPTTPKPAVYDT